MKMAKFLKWDYLKTLPYHFKNFAIFIDKNLGMRIDYLIFPNFYFNIQFRIPRFFNFGT